MRILNLYSGIGGNRKLWQNVEITAIEINQDIANVYNSNFPSDKIIVADAHKYLINHFHEFDFIWASPPCQSHSKMILSGQNRKPRYIDLTLWQEAFYHIRQIKNNEYIII